MRRFFSASGAMAVILTVAVAAIWSNTDLESVSGMSLSQVRNRHSSELTIEGGAPGARARLDLAVHRFNEAGLELPPLRIVFRNSSAEECHGGLGYFTPNVDVWQISICSDIDSVYEHELAHAWERANLTDSQRKAFMTFRGFPTWSDESYDWNQRGVEGIAVVIQHGLAGLDLPPALGDETTARLQAYEMLTGRVAPRLIEWTAQYELPCHERPTPLSRPIPDLSGRVCPRSRRGISR